MPRASAENLTEDRARALALWETDQAYFVRDLKQPGLFIFKGKRVCNYVIHYQRSRHGRRQTLSTVIGSVASMSLADARRFTRRKIGGDIAQSRTQAIKFNAAAARWLDHLRTICKTGSEWPANASGIIKNHLGPRFGLYTLASLSHSPAEIADYHAELVSKVGNAGANKILKTLRAIYRHAARLSRDLPMALPTSGVTWAKEEPREFKMSVAEFPKWFAQVMTIKSDTRKALHLLGMVTGMRQGDLRRARWSNLNLRERILILPDAKSGTIFVPLTWQIAQVLKLARDAAGDSEWVFPGRGSYLTRGNSDPISAQGHALRHIVKSIHVQLRLPEFHSECLLGHQAATTSKKYASLHELSISHSLRLSQAMVSREVWRRLGAQVCL